jgi:hypothetical protein
VERGRRGNTLLINLVPRAFARFRGSGYEVDLLIGSRYNINNLLANVFVGDTPIKKVKETKALVGNL